MRAADHERLTSWFLDAVSRQGDARAEILRRMRSDAPDLVAEVELLLRCDAGPPAIVRTGGAMVAPTVELAPGTWVGAYRILRRAGEGGMSVVYLAEQREPLQRVVALKVMRPGYAGLGDGSRFEAERRALERIEHPNVARVLDAGLDAEAGPYVVMEHVDGEPITAYADRRRLDVAARLHLFLPVCDAIAHAHAHGVLHRDVKPANVLVAEVDGAPVPKVIDFGIAVDLPDGAEGIPSPWEPAAFVGTPGYVSPELAARTGAHPDVRSDVYSLGCLLYELIGGAPPFVARRLGGLGLDAIGPFLLVTEPRVPSVALSEAADRAALAAARGARPRALLRRLRGDFDRIAAKAVARERSDRYATAHELAADLRRFLRHEPVAAAPRTAVYRLVKLVRRRRVAAASILALVGFAAVMAVQAARVARERDRARAFSESLLQLYQGSSSGASRGNHREPWDVVFGGLDRVRGALRDDPVYLARVDEAAGEALRAAGRSREALPRIEDAARRLAGLVGADDPIALRARRDLARALRDVGREEDAEPILEKVLAGQRRVLGADDREALRTTRELGEVRKRLGKYAAAAETLAEARAGWSRRPDGGEQERALVTSLLGATELELGRLADARPHIEEAIATLDDAGGEKGIALYNLACVHAMQGEPEAALDALRAAVAARFVINYFADPHLSSLHAEPAFEAIQRDAEFRTGPGLARVADEGERAIAAGRYADAERLFRTAIAAIPPSHGFNGFTTRLGDLYLLEGRWAEAEPLIRATLEQMLAELGPRSVFVALRWLDLARIRFALRDAAGARRGLDEAVAIAESDRDLGARSVAHYARACREAVAGRHDAALRELMASVDAGFQEFERLESEPCFRPLHAAPEWTRLTTLLRRRFALS